MNKIIKVRYEAEIKIMTAIISKIIGPFGSTPKEIDMY